MPTDKPITIEISGQPGAGKTLFFSQFIEWLKERGSVTHIQADPEDETHAVFSPASCFRPKKIPGPYSEDFRINLIIKTKQTNPPTEN